MVGRCGEKSWSSEGVKEKKEFDLIKQIRLRRKEGINLIEEIKRIVFSPRSGKGAIN